MADGRDKDGEAVSEGELEDGEVVSSDEEEAGGKGSESKLSPEETSPSALGNMEASEPARDCVGTKRPAPEETAAGVQEKRPKLDSPSPTKTDDLEDGEIYSDDEEAAYFPQRVKSRSAEEDDKKQTSPTPESPTKTERSQQGRGRERDNDRHSSPENTSGYHDRSYSSGYQRHKKDERSQSPRGVGFYEDRERQPENLDEGEDERRHNRSSSRTSYYSSPSHHGRRDRGNQSLSDEGDGGGSGYHQRGGGGRKGGYHSYHHGKGQRYNYKGSHHQRYWDTSGRILTGQAFNKLVREVKSRRDKGLPLLAIPGGTKPCNTLDQFNYPAPPSWYEEAVKEWDQKEEQRRKNTGVTEEGGGITEEGGRGQEAQVPMEQGDMKTSWSVPPPAPAQQIGLSTISLAETGTFIPVNTPIPLFGYDTRVPQDLTLSSTPKPLFAEVEVAGLGKGASKQPAAVEGGSEVTGEDKHVEMEEAERKDKETTQAGGNEDSSHPVGRTLATPTPTEISSQTEPVASTFLPVLNNRAPPTAGTPQGEPVIPQPDTEDDFDYDNYLDQLDKEEEEDMPGPVSANPLNEDFPLIAPGRQNKDVTGTDGHSLKDLLIGEVSGSAKEEARRAHAGSKSARRKQKDAIWRSRQKEWELQRHEEPPKPKLPCKYYLSGFCRHGDKCQFPHVLRERKKEVCKFYLQDSCKKGDECLYYHGTFPCKFFHTKTNCKNGDRCKFSHAPLTAEARMLLLSVLEPSRDPTKLLPGIPPMLIGTNLLGATPTPPPVTTGLGSMSTNLLPLGQSDGSQFHSNFRHTESQAQVLEVPASSLFMSQWEDVEGGGSAELAAEELVVSIPRVFFDHKYPVSIPFSKLKGQSNSKQRPLSQSEDSASKMATNQFPFPPPPFPQAMVVPDSLPPSFPPPLNPPYYPPTGQGGPIPLFPPKPVELPHIPQPFSGSGQSRRILLPTPPPHVRLTPEELERMESSVPEYWEAPNVNKLEHTPVVPPIPPVAPPLPPIPATSVHYQGSEKSIAVPYLPPPLSLPQSSLTGVVIPIQGTSGMELRPVAGPGISVRQRMEPRPAIGNVVNPIPHSISGIEVTAAGMDPRQMHMERGPLPGGMDPRQVRMDPRHQQHLPQSPPRTFGTHPPPPMASHPPPSHPFPPSAPLPSYPRPPFNTFYPSPASSVVVPPAGSMNQRPSPVPGSVTPSFGHHPAPHPGTSPVWGASSPEQPGRRAEGSRVGEGVLTLTPEPRRVDPRTKYAHLKIKAKSQGSSPSILKKGLGTLAGGDKTEQSHKKKDPAIEVPKLLQDPTTLDKPLDPQDLFVGLGIGTAESQEYGELKAPFVGFKSYFSGTGSNKGSQEFGEITLHKGQKRSETDHKTVEADREATLSEKDETAGVADTAESNAEEGTATKAMPSYLANLGLGAEDDLKIDSAFGSLENKKDDSVSRQHDVAKKMPSIYGFGSEQY